MRYRYRWENRSINTPSASCSRAPSASTSPRSSRAKPTLASDDEEFDMSIGMLRPVAVALLTAVVLSPPVAAAPASAGDLSVTLKPAAAAENGLIPYLDVIIAAPIADVSPGQPLLRVPLVI